MNEQLTPIHSFVCTDEKCDYETFYSIEDFIERKATILPLNALNFYSFEKFVKIKCANPDCGRLHDVLIAYWGAA